MTAVASVATWRPRDGKLGDFLAIAAKAKKIHERLGGKVRVWSQQFGAAPQTFGYVIEHKSWAAFGTFGDELSADKEWLALIAAAGAKPTADLVGNSVVVETPV